MRTDKVEHRREIMRAAAKRHRDKRREWDHYYPDLLRTPPKSIEETIAAFKPAADAARNEKMAKFKRS